MKIQRAPTFSLMQALVSRLAHAVLSFWTTSASKASAISLGGAAAATAASSTTTAHVLNLIAFCCVSVAAAAYLYGARGRPEIHRRKIRLGGKNWPVRAEKQSDR
jgi:hypothetical protein